MDPIKPDRTQIRDQLSRMGKLEVKIAMWFEYYWRECRNDSSTLAPLRGAIKFAWETGQITAEIAELWYRRIRECPGHNDESGRSWCAYCGPIPPLDPNAPHSEDCTGQCCKVS